LACAAILAAILSPVREEPQGTPPDRVVAQEGKTPIPPKPSSPEEVGLADQIAFQERLLEKTADEKDRALVQATLKTLRGELARAKKGKSASKKTEDPAGDRAAWLRNELESVELKLKMAKTIEDAQRLEAKQAQLAQELGDLERGNPPPSKDPGPKGFRKPDPGGAETSPSPKDKKPQTGWLEERLKDPKLQITFIEGRLKELKAILSKAELPEPERARAQKEFSEYQAELDRLKPPPSGEKKK
jgi:hypothetical protein